MRYLWVIYGLSDIAPVVYMGLYGLYMVIWCQKWVEWKSLSFIWVISPLKDEIWLRLMEKINHRSDAWDAPVEKEFQAVQLRGDQPSFIPSGNLWHSYWKCQVLMGKSTMSMAIFNSYVTNYQRVHHIGRFIRYGGFLSHGGTPKFIQIIGINEKTYGLVYVFYMSL